MKDKIIIRGIRKDGTIFRPSTWAERLSEAAALFGKDKRLVYSTLVIPCSSDKAGSCVGLAIDRTLELSRPTLYKFLISFAEENDLEIDYGGEES